MRIPAANALDLRLGRWQDVLADVGECDALIVDPPYSARTHDGHGNATRWGTRAPHVYDDSYRRPIGYEHMSEADVAAFAEAWMPRVCGWVVVFTDHVLMPTWEAALADGGRTTFAPLPFYSPGSRVRLAGDGPACWTTWIVVARPKALSRWGSLPGGYLFTGERGAAVVGAKPLSLMRAIVRDYSRPGDLVCDPCSGGGTTALACHAEGRRFVGAECAPTTYEKAKRRIDDALRQQPLPFAPAREAEQHALFDEAP